MRAWNGWYHVNGNTFGTWLRGDARGWRARHHREHVEGDYKNPPPPGTYDGLRASSRRLMKRDKVWLTAPARDLACRELVASLLCHGIEVIALAVDDHHFHLLARFRLQEELQGMHQAHGSVRESGSQSKSPSDSGRCLQSQSGAIRGLGSADKSVDVREEGALAEARIPARKDGNAMLALIRHFIGIAKKASALALARAGLAPYGGVWAKRCRALAIRDRAHQVKVFKYIVAHSQHGAAVWTFRNGRKDTPRRA